MEDKSLVGLFESEVCYICSKITEPWAGDPGLWRILLPFKNGNGAKRSYHIECVVRALEKVHP